MTISPACPTFLGALLLASAMLSPAHAAKVAPPADLGTLNDGYYAAAFAINRNGVVIGNAMDGVTLTTRQVIWRNGQVIDWAGCCGSGQGVPKAINLAGEAVGYNEGGFDTYPVYWSAAGAWVELPGLPGASSNRGAAGDINNAGLVAGHVRGTEGGGFSRHAVLWQGGLLVRDMGFLGQPDNGLINQTMAYGLNNAGTVVGTGLVGSEMHAFVWRNGTYTDLGPGQALDITDDEATIVGNAPGLIPVVWRGGVRSYLRALGGGAMAYGHTVSAMNNKGEVAGFAPATKAPYLDTAVLWRGGKAIDLGRHPGGTVSRAYGINDKGQVVGEGNLEPNGPMHALRWITKAGQVVAVERAD
jgi:probable HAF family extracellular repeat protein